jgi:hypothetical protein
MVFFDQREIANLIAAGQIKDACTHSLLLLYFVKQEDWFVPMKSDEPVY